MPKFSREFSEYLSPTLPAREFRAFVGIDRTQQGNLRRSGVLVEIGRETESGLLLFSKQDAVAVYLAKRYVAAGFNWSEALEMGQGVEGMLSHSRVEHWRSAIKDFTCRFVVFVRERTNVSLKREATDDLNAAVAKLSNETDASAIVHVVDVVAAYNSLPTELREALDAIERAEA